MGGNHTIMTKKLYYEDPYQIRFMAKAEECVQRPDGFAVRLNETAFYPEGGGQPYDTGRLGDTYVREVHEKDGDIWHYTDREILPGSMVEGVIDWERRFDHMQQHSGEHIVSGMICRRFGCDNIGFHLGSEVIEIDFNHEIPEEEIRKLQDEANRYLWENHELEILWPSPEELAQLEYRSKKELTGEVRITRWPGADICACCGTHVRRSGEIGQILLLSSMRMKGGTRIEMICGARALAYLKRVKEQNDEISHLLSAKWNETAAAVKRLQTECVEGKVRENERQLSLVREAAVKHAGAGNVLLFENRLSPDNFRKLVNDVMETCGGICVAFTGDEKNGYRYCAGQKDGNLKEFTRELNAALNGRGGGKPYFVQGQVSASREEIERYLKAEF